MQLDVSKLLIRVDRIIKCEKHAEAEKLYTEQAP